MWEIYRTENGYIAYTTYNIPYCRFSYILHAIYILYTITYGKVRFFHYCVISLNDKMVYCSKFTS